ncbi:PA14 domain-containing protein [Hymenobacter terricola]|uniref:PA14 domain-containing protein n=1 Tax=Hymenobacter terricola TaxID=2819236 RepID=UPI001B3153FB|nr:PA14 domain-containing protein [Hymenobacter terricola]
MAWLTDRRLRELLLAMLALGLPAAPARAQAPLPTGDGITGDYYDGVEFDRLVLSRRDATLAFDWTHQPPAPGVPAEYFSVRWTGWLVPPASGRYVFHATVDDGMRIWLNDKLILNEWRPQPVRTFTTSIKLNAGEPYRLRVEYFQEILDTRARITWERPDEPLKSPPSSWRNFWGRTAETPRPGPIPTQFLFSRNPRPVVARPAPAKLPSPVPRQSPVVARPAPVPTRPSRPAAPPRRPAPAPLAPVAAARVEIQALPPPSVLLADSGSTARLSGLGVGETITLPELYFNQGQAVLLPAARRALDGLAAALSARPTLRFEVQGHTDNVGNAELNRQLSQQRADAVCRYLAAHGVAPERLRSVGYGGTQPVADNADPTQRPRNRRVVLRRL